MNMGMIRVSFQKTIEFIRSHVKVVDVEVDETKANEEKEEKEDAEK